MGGGGGGVIRGENGSVGEGGVGGVVIWGLLYKRANCNGGALVY